MADYASRAQAAREDFKAVMNSAAKSAGLVGVMGPDKTAGRIAEKAVMDYGGDLNEIRDAVRGEIIVTSRAQAEHVALALKANPAIIRLKDTTSTPSVLGWRDLKGIVRMPNGSKGEIQVVFDTMEHARRTGGTAIYTKMRKAAVGSAPYLAAMAASVALYNQAFGSVPKGGS